VSTSRASKLHDELADRLKRLDRGDRSLVPVFEGSELIYHRLPPTAFKNGVITDHGIKSPRWSVNRGSFADEWDTLIKIDQSGYQGLYLNYAVVSFAASDLPPEMKSGDDADQLEQRDTFRFKLEHDPYDKNYAHSEVRTFKNDVLKTWSNGVKYRFRLKLIDKLNPVLPPLSSE